MTLNCAYFLKVAYIAHKLSWLYRADINKGSLGTILLTLSVSYSLGYIHYIYYCFTMHGHGNFR